MKQSILKIKPLVAGKILIGIVITFFFLSISLNAQTNFNTVLRIAGFKNDVEINSILRKENYFYVASNFSNSYLKTYNINSKGEVSIVDSLFFLNTGDKEIAKIIIDGNYLFATGTKGLLVFDLNNPAKPNLVSHIKSVMDNTTARSINSSCLAKSGNNLLIESGWAGCMLLDVSNVTNPTFKDIVTYTGVANDISFINSNNAILTDGYSLVFIDCSNTDNLQVKTTSIYGDTKATLFDPNKNVVYVSSESVNNSYVFAVNAGTKTVIDSIETTTQSSSLGRMTLKNSDTLLVGGSSVDFIVLNVNDVNNITVLTYYKNSFYGGSKKSIMCDGNQIYAADYDDFVIYNWDKTTNFEEIYTHNQNTFELYPNPSNGVFTFENKITEKLEVKIFDINGKLVDLFHSNENSSQLLNYSFLVNGLYLLNITTQNGKVNNSKMLIVK